jgi:hypothetical protein
MKRNLSQLYNPTIYFEFECPNCAAAIPYLNVKIDFKTGYKTNEFECSACRISLCVSRSYAWCVLVGTLAALVAIILALKALNVRPWWILVVAALVLWKIVGMLESVYLKWLFPPKIEYYYPDGPSLTQPRRKSNLTK